MRIYVQKLREDAELWRVDADTGADIDGEKSASRIKSLSDRLIMFFDELEAMRKPERPDVAEWREEVARIDATWVDCCRSPDDAAVVDATRALLEKALAAIDAGWPEPVAITDAVVEEAANMLSASEHAMRLVDARTVLEYAASLGGVAPVSQASRPFRPTAAMGQSVMVGACAAANFTEEQTIERLAAHAAVLEKNQRRLLSETPDAWRIPEPPAGKCAADRLTDYRHGLLLGYASNRAEMIREWRFSEESRYGDFDAWLANKTEHLAHAMLAAEKEPTNAL